ncbi:hypothetical protein N7523_010987 [Penicillium sp. IBT 18751x]|nr:hypothetical protein N7523_010987 [Penicillium sp. IBT 18751x]
MTSKAFTEGKFLVPPDLRPPPPGLKRRELPPRSRSKSQSAQPTHLPTTLNSESNNSVTFSKSKKTKESKKSATSKRSMKGKKPKPHKQAEQPTPEQQQQQQQQQQDGPKMPPAFQPHPFRRETILELRRNPPSLSAPPAKETSTKTQIALPKIKSKKVKRRMATIYDVIARRVGPHGFLKKARASKYRDTTSSTQKCIAPMDHLFRRPVHWNNKVKGEPYLKTDKLPPDNPTDRKMKYPRNRFPDNDLLTAMHAYAADKYILGHERGRKNRNFVSFNESALLAFGILIEELSRSAIGPSGDIPMLRASVPEAEENRRIDPLEWWWRGNKRRKDQKFVRENYRVEYHGNRVRFVRTRKRKPKSQLETDVKDDGTDAKTEDTDGQSVQDDHSTPIPHRSRPLKRRRSTSRSQSVSRSRAGSKKRRLELSSEFVDDND